MKFVVGMSSILDTIEIDFYPGRIWITSPLGKITLRQFIESHRNPKPEIKEVFKKIAEAEVKEDWETKGKLKQNNLFYFTPCVNLDGKGRSYDNIESFNGLLVTDFDHITMDAGEFRDRLFEKYESIICAYKSPSSKGVKAIFQIPRVTSVDEFKSYFYGISYVMEGVKSFDESSQNSCLPLFLSWDENIRFRENPKTWTLQGGKHNEFEEYVGDIEEIEDVTSEDKKEIIRMAYNIIKKADEEKCGHPNILKSTLIFSAFIPSNYISYDEVKGFLFKWIDDSDYLSQKATTYKKTVIDMMERGMRAPLYLDKHKPQLKNEELKKETVKKDRKYYLIYEK